VPRLRRRPDHHALRRLRRVLRGRGLRIPSSVRAELERHAREEAPNEACGLLVLQDGEAVRYERGRNAEASPYRFRLDISSHVWFLEDDGYELAVFHSHASSPPRPSRADVEQIGLWRGRPYLVLRADTGELAAWRIYEDRIEPQALST
jgi:proteasome lid subunit RPN8/RPN11